MGHTSSHNNTGIANPPRRHAVQLGEHDIGEPLISAHICPGVILVIPTCFAVTWRIEGGIVSLYDFMGACPMSR
eukprot:3110387-Rhodomonas_salina.2